MKSLFLTASTFLLIGSTFALPVENAKVLSHHETIPLNTKMVFNKSTANAKLKLIEQMQLKALPVTTTNIAAISKMGDTNYFVTDNQYWITFSGSEYSATLIANNTDSAKTYTIVNDGCIIDSQNFTAAGCAYTTDEVSIEAHSYYEDTAVPTIEMSVAGPGTYFLSMSRHVFDDKSQTDFSADDGAELTIPASQ